MFADEFYAQTSSGCHTLSQISEGLHNSHISFMRGHLVDRQTDSQVYGYAKDGVFHGRIKDGATGKSFYVENVGRLSQMFNATSEDTDDPSVHSIIYDESQFPNAASHQNNHPKGSSHSITTACAYQGATKDFMDHIQVQSAHFASQVCSLTAKKGYIIVLRCFECFRI